MMGKLWGRALFVLVVLCGGLAWAAGCWSSGNQGGSGSPDGSVNPTGSLCARSCSKACSVDDDCLTNNGELCCHYGASGSVCQLGTTCPQFCMDDTKCDTVNGQGCV